MADNATTTISAAFQTREAADYAIEHLVQQHGFERTDIFVAPEGGENSAGEAISGSDRAAAEPSVEPRADGALNGRIEVSVDVEDDSQAGEIRGVFAELGGAGG